MNKFIIIILAVLNLVACGQSSPSEEQTANLSLPKFYDFTCVRSLLFLY